MLSLSSETPYGKDLYARGYIFRDDQAPNAPAGWHAGTFGGYYMAHDPRLEATRVSHARCDLLALGTIVDVRHPEESAAACLDRLALALSRSEDALHAALDHTGGRYVLAYAGPDGRSAIVSDATGMKPVFYYTGTPKMVVSHPHLILENADEALRAPLRAKFGYPGLRGPVRKSFMLTPNARLDFETLAPRRVWPREAVAERSVAQAAEIVRANMAGLVRCARRRGRLLVSTTAGLDSRVTLSFLEGAEDVRYFTYYRSDRLDTDPADLAFAGTLRDELGLDVAVLRFDTGPKMTQDFRALMDANTFMEHQRHLGWLYARHYGGEQGLVHLRSNISEVGREFWRINSFEVSSGRELARLYLHGKREYPSEYVFRVIDLFEEFDRVTGLTACGDLVDVKSLFYWEFRMASWHAQLLCESDPAFDTLSLFNCRATLAAMLSVPREARRSSAVLRQVIGANWPELTKFPVNGKPFWPEAARA